MSKGGDEEVGGGRGRKEEDRGVGGSGREMVSRRGREIGKRWVGRYGGLGRKMGKSRRSGGGGWGKVGIIIIIINYSENR